MAAITPDYIMSAIKPYTGQILDVVGMVLQLLLILGILVYGFYMYLFDTKVNVREYSKGGRTIAFTTKAKRIKDKKTGTPKLKLIGKFGFGGDEINEPPAECLIAFRSRLTNRMYDFIRKDGLYYPVQNFVLGARREIVQDGKKVEIYTTEGTGLEISRDYDAEQAIQNTLIEKATAYRNKKPTEIIASYALMIITIITCGIVMWFAWKQFGNMAGAIAELKQPLKEGIIGAAQGIIGPG